MTILFSIYLLQEADLVHVSVSETPRFLITPVYDSEIKLMV